MSKQSIAVGLLDGIEDPSSQELNGADVGADLLLGIAHRLFHIEALLCNLGLGINARSLAEYRVMARGSAKQVLALMNAEHQALLPEFEQVRRAVEFVATYCAGRKRRLTESERELAACWAIDIGALRAQVAA